MAKKVVQTSLFQLCIQCSRSVACSCTVWRCLHLSCPMVIDTSQAETKDLMQLRDRWCFLCSTSGVRHGWCPFQVLCQRKESREPFCSTLQGLDHCQAPPTQEGTWLRLGLRLLLHSLWGITLSSAAPCVPTASPDLGWARLWRTSEGQFSSSSDLGPA